MKEGREAGIVHTCVRSSVESQSPFEGRLEIQNVYYHERNDVGFPFNLPLHLMRQISPVHPMNLDCHQTHYYLTHNHKNLPLNSTSPTTNHPYPDPGFPDHISSKQRRVGPIFSHQPCKLQPNFFSSQRHSKLAVYHTIYDSQRNQRMGVRIAWRPASVGVWTWYARYGVRLLL